MFKRWPLLLAACLVGCGSTHPLEGGDERVGSQALEIGVEDDDTGMPLGGGEGYGAWITPEQADTIAFACRDLINAIDNHITYGSPDVIYVDDESVLDCSEEETGVPLPLHIPNSITIASGRGRNGSLGALIFSNTTHFSNTTETRALFQVSSFVRITGLRLQGPDSDEVPPCECLDNDSIGIHVLEASDVEIDNNEMWGWPWAAVWSEDGFGTHVHHNHIHHNRRKLPSGAGLGYGVQADIGDTLIESNIFDHNRHDVASAGWPGSDYEARFNVSMQGSEQSYDCHGGEDREDSTDIACGTILIHSNTVLLDPERYAVDIRGIPEVAAEVFENEFWCAHEKACVVQPNAEGNLIVHDNDYDVNKYPAWFASMSAHVQGIDEAGPGSSWSLRRFEGTPLAVVGMGRFDANKSWDALRSTGSTLEISPGTSGDWAPFVSSSVPISDMGFADFDGNGTTDLFAQWSGHWWVFPFNGSTVWHQLNTSSYGPGSVGFADFDGNGKADVIRTTGTTWEVSHDGTGGWSSINSSSVGLADLRFGYFIGSNGTATPQDALADAFYADGTEFKVSSGGSGHWVHLNWSEAPIEELAAGDFNGDSTTDILWVHDDEWLVSFNGTESWVAFNSSAQALSELRLADVNGDGRTDILAADD